VLQPIGRRRWSHPTAAIALTLTMMHSGALGALLQFARAPWYPAHAAGAAAWHLTALEDQQLAGLVMAVPAGIVYIVAAIVVLYRWLDSGSERSYLERLCVESSPSLAS
jgi:putative membrane protein